MFAMCQRGPAVTKQRTSNIVLSTMRRQQLPLLRRSAVAAAASAVRACQWGTSAQARPCSRQQWLLRAPAKLSAACLRTTAPDMRSQQLVATFCLPLCTPLRRWPAHGTHAARTQQRAPSRHATRKPCSAIQHHVSVRKCCNAGSHCSGRVLHRLRLPPAWVAGVTKSRSHQISQSPHRQGSSESMSCQTYEHAAASLAKRPPACRPGHSAVAVRTMQTSALPVKRACQQTLSTVHS